MTVKTTGYNQDGKTVITFERTLMVYRRGHAPRDNQAHPGRRDVSVTRTATARELASFLARLRYEDVPDGAVERTKELFLDWLGSALAGKNERPVRILERFAGEMGPSEGRARS